MIDLRNLRKEFDTVIAVDDLNLSVPEGEIFGLIGPNGAGKTTTILMACGLLRPTLGDARIAGIDVAEEPENAQQYIGYLSDFFALYEELKVWEYLDFFAHAYKMHEPEIPTRINEVIAQVGLEVKRDALIQGLSRGMKQRLGIARAIIHRPRVLLLDEPASGLDPKTRLDLRNLLRSLRDRGTTIVISSHILTELEGFCTSIGIMEKGRMIRSGRIDEITAADSPPKLIRVTWIGESVSSVLRTLKAHAAVSEVKADSQEGTFRFSGSEGDLAVLLRQLVASGLLVTSFGAVRQTVEDLYMRLSTHEVT